MSNEDEIRKLISQRRRYLQKLREKEAKLGTNTPVDVLLDIEDIETEIERLQADLERLGEEFLEEQMLDLLKLRSENSFDFTFWAKVVAGLFVVDFIYVLWPTNRSTQMATSHSDLRILTPVGSPEILLSVKSTYRIAFSTKKEEDWDIYIVDEDGTNVQPLATTTNDEIALDWSKETGKIIYSSGNRYKIPGGGDSELFIMNVDGSEKQQLTTDMSDVAMASWSPDDTRIAIASNQRLLKNPDMVAGFTGGLAVRFLFMTFGLQAMTKEGCFKFKC
jgi:hypothetical protein